jgi:CRP-like cAMP-binding protein
LDFFSFIYLSSLNIYKEGDLIFSKDEECNSYIFILNGDINLFADISLNSSKIESTISSGNIYGHLIKDKYKYYIKARNNTSIIIITKANFDELIMSINKRIKTFKSIFIKKFFPNIRIFSDDLIHNILTYFERIQYQKYDKIFSKGNYNEYIYLIISGEVGFCLKSEDILNNTKINIDNNYIIFEKLSKGDIIGIKSSFEGIKNKYNCLVLSDEAEFYRISKGDLLYYFNRRNYYEENNDLILDIKSIGDLQDMAFDNKYIFLKNNSSNKDILNKFIINIDESKNNNNIENNNYEIVYEAPIDNILYQKWRNVKLGLDEMKNKLIGQKKKRIDENKKINNKDNEGINKTMNNLNKNKYLLDMYKVTNGKLNLKLNNNQIKSLNKFNDIYGIKNNEHKTKKEKEIKLNEEEKDEKKY